MLHFGIRFSRGENIFVEVKAAKRIVSPSKTWDMVTLKGGDYHRYYVKSNTTKLFYIKLAVNGKRQRFHVLLNRQKLFRYINNREISQYRMN